MAIKECVPNERLRHVRSLQGWSQAKLAEEVGTSFEIVSRWERGITMPSSYFRARLCVALGTTAEELGLIQGSEELLVPFVFLACSYADTEKAIVTQLKTVLQEQRLPLHSSRQIRRPGVEHPSRVLGEAIRAAQMILLIVSPHARSSRHVREALELARMYRRPVLAIWIEGEHWQECLPPGTHELPVSIDARTRDDPSLFEEIVTLLQHGWLDPGTTTSSAPAEAKERLLASEPRNPYKGLQAFHQADQHDFFGRDGLIDELTSALAGALQIEQPGQQSARLLAIIGPSGSGKSSVMMAGLLSRLQQGGLPDSEEWIYLSPIVPGMHPIESLALAFAERLPDRNLLMLRHDLEGDSARGLHQLAAALTPHQGTRVLLVVDQFEELFTQTSTQEERQQFIDLLVCALTEPRGPVMVVLTLRADFYDRVLSCSALGSLIEQHHCAVHPMDIQELRMVIERPAHLPDVQLTFEGDLVGDLLFEMHGQVGALPLLQFTLDQLFQRRCGHQLTYAAYYEVGGVKGALARHAECTYASLPSEKHQRLARTLFLRLIKPGATEQDATRRRAARSELLLPDPVETVILEEVTEAFIKAHLLTSNTLAGTAVLEVSHEALIREWPRLANWLQGAREDIRLQQTISQDAVDWQERSKPKDRLYRGSQLMEAKAWARRNSPSSNELAFLCASTAARIRYCINALVIILLLLSMAGLTVWFRLHLPPDPRRVTTLENDGPGSLRWAIDNAPAGSTITFDTNLQGTILLTSDHLHISKLLHIRGPGAGHLSISGGKNRFGLDVLPAGSASTVSDLTLKMSYISNDGTFTLINSIVRGNEAVNTQAGEGRTIYNDGTLTLNSSTVSGGAATRSGGGIYNDGTLTLNSSTVSNNAASHSGGGIYNDGTLTLNSSTVSGNTASHSGGGIHNNGTLTLNSSTISTNTASHSGGGIYNNGTLTLSNSTISTNTAAITGGGIANRGSTARTAITFCTIYDNTASHSGGGIWNDTNDGGRQLVMRNSLVAGNRAAQSPDIVGQLTSQGYNLIQSTAGAMFAPNQLHGTDLLQVASPALRIDPVLKGNNGPTRTHALLPGSLAIHRIPPNACHIKGISTDQRGVKRPEGAACDIGAYEMFS
jgi:transcriptional regulator with XRE-family HTH domain